METTPQVVLVTGASSGIGEATAKHAAARGDHLVLLARGEQALQRVASECESLGAESVLVCPTDVAQDEEVASAVETAVARHGRLDVVIGNAGVVAYGSIDALPIEVFNAVIGTNLIGSVNLARHVLPVLREQDSGSFVLVGSLLGHIAAPQMAAYVISKWGVRGLFRQLRVDNRDRPGIRFAYIAPGGVDTPIYLQAANYSDSVGRPPFPVASPEHVAARTLAAAEQPWRGGQVGAANQVIRFGFVATPWLYDRLVSPLFRVVAQDLVPAVVQGPGNVLSTLEEHNRLRGGQGSALLGITRNVGEVAKDRVRRLTSR